MTSFDLRRLKLRSGEEHRDEVELELQPLEFGGQRYLPVPEKVAAELVVNRATTGTAFRLRFPARLHGPCYRCLGDAVLDVAIDAREYQATNPDSEELALGKQVIDGAGSRALGIEDLLWALLNSKEFAFNH